MILADDLQTPGTLFFGGFALYGMYTMHVKMSAALRRHHSKPTKIYDWSDDEELP